MYDNKHFFVYKLLFDKQKKYRVKVKWELPGSVPKVRKPHSVVQV